MEDNEHPESLDPDFSVLSGFVLSVVLASSLGTLAIIAIAFCLIRRKMSTKGAKEAKGVIYKSASNKEDESISKA